MSLLPRNSKKLNPCPHGNFAYCPSGCYQTDLELAIMDLMREKVPDSEEGLLRIIKYKQAIAAELTADLSEVLQELNRLEERLQNTRKK